MRGQEYRFNKTLLLEIASKIIEKVSDAPDDADRNDTKRKFKLEIDQGDGTGVYLRDPDGKYLFTIFW